MSYGEGGAIYRGMEPSRFLADLPPALFGLTSRAGRGPAAARPGDPAPPRRAARASRTSRWTTRPRREATPRAARSRGEGPSVDYSFDQRPEAAARPFTRGDTVVARGAGRGEGAGLRRRRPRGQGDRPLLGGRGEAGAGPVPPSRRRVALEPASTAEAPAGMRSLRPQEGRGAAAAVRVSGGAGHANARLHATLRLLAPLLLAVVLTAGCDRQRAIDDPAGAGNPAGERLHRLPRRPEAGRGRPARQRRAAGRPLRLGHLARRRRPPRPPARRRAPRARWPARSATWSRPPRSTPTGRWRWSSPAADFAIRNGATPRFDPATASCSTTYCHGATLDAGGTNQAPTWNGGSAQAACGTCHGAPPPSHAATSTTCSTCHPRHRQGRTAPSTWPAASTSTARSR